MRFSTDLSLILLSASTALAAPGLIEERFPHKPPHTRTQCYTSVQSTGKSPKHLSTKYYTHYKTCTSTVEHTVTKTTSKHGKYTQTVTSTSTVAAVSTVMPGPAFTPIADTLQGSDYDPALDPSNQTPLLEREDLSERTSRKKGTHPVEVVCYDFVDKCEKATTLTTTTTVAPSSVPTVKRTTTVTSTTYTSSYYAACATNNFANTYNGDPIDNVISPHNRNAITGIFEYISPSAYNCCVNAMAFPPSLAGNTPIWLWGRQFSSDNPAICEITVTDRCLTPRQRDYGVQTESSTDFALVVGNAQCGQFVPRPLPSSTAAIVSTSSSVPTSSSAPSTSSVPTISAAAV